MWFSGGMTARSDVSWMTGGLALLVACGGGSASVASSVPSKDEALVVPRLVVDTSHVAVPDAHARAEGCRLEGRVATNLRLSYDTNDPAATFGEVIDASGAAIVLGNKARAPTSVVVDVLAVTVDAQVPEDGMLLHAHAPLGLAGVYDPNASTPLHWRLTDQGLVVRAEPETSVKPLVPLEGAAACTAIGLEQTQYAPRPLPKEIFNAVTRKAVGLAATPGGPSVGEMKADFPVAVLEQKGAHARITFEDRGIWVGWVLTSALLKKDAGAGYGYGSGHGRLGPRPYSGGHTCSDPLPLYVRKVGAPTPLARVGTVQPNRRVALSDSKGEGDYRPLLDEQRATPSERTFMTLNEGFELVVRRDASASCTPTSSR